MHLITGGLGFIGNELARQLRREGAVTILDNRNRVAPQIDDLDSIPTREVDLTDSAALSRAIAELKPEVVHHLAAIHFIPECNANPERTLRVNVEATLGLLRACSANGVKHVLFASSGAVYADSPDPLHEGSPLGPVDIYGWSKAFAEDLCRWHAQQEGLPITLCRFFNNYGPRETNAHIIPEIIQQLRKGDDLYLGNISPRRDYVHTRDTARAMIRLAKQIPAGTRTVNVASGDSASVSELIALMADLLGRPLRVHKDLSRFRKADKEVQVADVRLLRELTGNEPSVSLREGLRDLLRFEGLL